ncbi:hypothetical protein RvY_09286 [Ramazzottius varieornatus]|uniref:Integrator complex subunit 5 C-terminal domain-containing protein n=1 Tax=Ramazzottius varieornatus TaxID=947166 RepID=A0A1D1VEC8_RAMVA|nr:hypothetical protein RvY_09286 [Ramazzottius varieornatus]
METFSLNADGLLRLSQLRRQQTKDPVPSKTENDLGRRAEAMDIEQNQVAELRLSAKTVDVPANIPNEKASLQGRCVDFLDRFRIGTLSEPCTVTLPDFVHLLSIKLLDERNDKECDGMIRDLLVHNRAKFLTCLQHLNWTWKSLLENEQLHTLFLKDIIPACGDPEEKVLMAQIALKMFSNAIQEEGSSLADDFTLVLEELCRLPDFAAVFMWMLVALLACEETDPFFSGGVCQIPVYINQLESISLYDANAKHLSSPSLLRLHPDPRELKFIPKNGIVPIKTKRILRTVTVKAQQVRRNQALILDALWFCCEAFGNPPASSLAVSQTQSSPRKSDTVASASAEPMNQDSPSSPVPETPSSPPPEATGLPLESPASPDLPEMRSSKVLDEKLPDRFRVEYKELGIKVSVIAAEPRKTDEKSFSYIALKQALYKLGGWYWLAVCLIDILKPEASDIGVTWPEFHTVAFFNRNVHIVKVFRKNPVWMKILEAAATAQPNSFLYYSPLFRPFYIHLHMHWETSLDGPLVSSNAVPREQSLWLFRCLGKAKLIHEPYTFLPAILDQLAPFEISSILASLWKVITTYFPNPHGLFLLSEAEQSYRARQMAETDCLLKIRAVVFSRLGSLNIVARKFFMASKVPLEESRWYESTQSQDVVSAPAPLNAAQLTKVD